MNNNMVATKQFVLEHTVYFNETNAVGGVVYFSNYVKWQGEAREAYFLSTVPEWKEIATSVALGQLNMITVEEHSFFLQHAFFGERLRITLQTLSIKKYSFCMIFTVQRASDSQCIYEGIQKLAFDDFRGKFVEIPKPMLKSVLEHEMLSTNPLCERLKKYF